MTDYSSPYTRLQTYFTYFTQSRGNFSERRGVSIKELHTITGLPLEVIREDIRMLLKHWNNVAFDDTSDEYFEVDEKEGLSDIDEQIEDDDERNAVWHKLLTDGKLDDIPVNYAVNLRGENKQCSVAVSFDEEKAVMNYLTEKNVYKKGKGFESKYQIKDSYRFSYGNKELNQNLEIINQAINDEDCLLMKYKQSNGEIKEIIFKPLKLAYDSRDNLYRVISYYKGKIKVHRLDRILNLERYNGKISFEEPADNFLQHAPNVWGCDFMDKPVKVRVKFFNEGNVLQKVERDLAYRSDKKLDKYDTYLYYEDVVYGKNAFAAWIRGFGSSAVVLEPKEIRDKIINSLEERLARAEQEKNRG